MRMGPEGADLVPRAIGLGMLLTGWSRASELARLTDREEFREHGILTYFPGAEKPWTPSQLSWIDGAYRFMHEIKPGDLVLVPHKDHFYITSVTGAASYAPGAVDDSAHRRPAIWLTGPIPRTAAQALRNSFYYAGTCCSLDKHKETVVGLLDRYRSPGLSSALWVDSRTPKC